MVLLINGLLEEAKTIKQHMMAKTTVMHQPQKNEIRSYGSSQTCCLKPVAT